MHHSYTTGTSYRTPYGHSYPYNLIDLASVSVSLMPEVPGTASYRTLAVPAAGGERREVLVAWSVCIWLSLSLRVARNTAVQLYMYGNMTNVYLVPGIN